MHKRTQCGNSFVMVWRCGALVISGPSPTTEPGRADERVERLSIGSAPYNILKCMHTKIQWTGWEIVNFYCAVYVI